jgi:uncharacterized protein Veg
MSEIRTSKRGYAATLAAESGRNKTTETRRLLILTYLLDGFWILC